LDAEDEITMGDFIEYWEGMTGRNYESDFLVYINGK
jgi:hypothetical protein